MALRFVTIVRLRALLLIAVTGALLGTMTHIMVARAWEQAFEREADAAAQSIAAAVAWKALPPDFLCEQMPLGNIQSIRIEGRTAGAFSFDSRECPSMRDAVHAQRAVVRQAASLSADGDSVWVIVSVWDPVRDQLAGDIALFMGILCAAVLVFVFIVSSALQKKYEAGIRTVSAQTTPAPDSTTPRHASQTFEELADMSHMFTIVRESAARDIESARNVYTAQGVIHSKRHALWESTPFTVTAFRLDPGDESGLAWAWRRDTSLCVLLARFDHSPPGNASEFGLMWRGAMESRQPEELEGIAAAFAPDGFCCCEFEPGTAKPHVLYLHNMQQPRHAVHGTSMSTAASQSTESGTWVIVEQSNDRRES